MGGASGNAAGTGADRVGVVSAALSTAPESGCVSAVSTASGQSRQYWRCPSRSWSSARAKCIGVGLDLAKVSNGGENAFLKGFVTGDSWLGGSDQVTEGTWRWGEPAAGEHFWQGNFLGSAVGGAYANWDLLQPGGLLGDCLDFSKGTGKWRERGCGSSRPYVCSGPEDQCPSDPSKEAPGQCGCGEPDTDADGDGTADCVDGCPSDPGKTTSGQCGCGGTDTDSDADAIANCEDACPFDSERSTLPCSPDTDCDFASLGCKDPEITWARTITGSLVTDRVELYIKWFQGNVAARAGLLLHEARHWAGFEHNAGADGKKDSSFNYQGAWAWHAAWLNAYAHFAVDAPDFLQCKAWRSSVEILRSRFTTPIDFPFPPAPAGLSVDCR